MNVANSAKLTLKLKEVNKFSAFSWEQARKKLEQAG